MKIDTVWFTRKIEESHYGSQRQLAKAMKINQSNLSRLLSGERAMRLDEVPVLARLLEVSQLEILRRAGLKDL